MELKDIRSTFLDFFKKNGHTIIPSSPLIPHNDPTLMFTAAGMVQFKNYFTGLETPKFKTAASSQKCVRAGGKHNDLENVGYTARHHTFFEMLGNFSFGDYFKEKAIELAWRCLTKEFNIPKDKLYITVFHTDDEAYNIWKKLTGFSDSKILRITTNDNFWSMGEVGPCGPCSEIFFDHGEKIPGGLPGTPDSDGDRYVEIWNLVFMQFEDQPNGKRANLPKPSIDTGMGLERITAALQGKHNNYEIDLFENLIAYSKQLSKNPNLITSHRVIADHLRSSCFLIADGVMPSNEGRGYVLRRIMRRAMRHVHNLSCKDPLLFRLVPRLVSEMGEAYPELTRAQPVIESTLKFEEERFLSTVEKGIKLLEESTESLKEGDTLNGKIAFKLYDTYGFPIDLTSDLLKSRKISIDYQTFESEMEAQKKRARAAWIGSGEKATDEIWYEIHSHIGTTEFIGYTSNEGEAIVKAIVQDGKIVTSASSGNAVLVLNQTPFYSEAGGQVGDTGFIGIHTVIDTKKYINSIYGHHVNLQGNLQVGDIVHARIDVSRRQKIKANHSATHLLHKALQEILGLHVVQKGSLVAEERLRFDFSHSKALTAEELEQIEKKVNEMIIANSPILTKLMPPEKAIDEGAMALFGEKYGEEVRVVSMGISKELCGGTHVNATGDIGLFKIASEQSIASGIRRIEALTGIRAIEYVNENERIIKKLEGILLTQKTNLENEVTKILQKNGILEDQVIDGKIDKALTNLQKPEKLANGIEFLSHKVINIPDRYLKNVIEKLKSKITNGVIVLGSINDSKGGFVIYVSKDLSSRIMANKLIQEVKDELAGNGGGKPEYAQAGVTNLNGIDRAIKKLKSMIEQ